MIHGSVGVTHAWMSHQKVQFQSSGSQPETQRTERPQFHHGHGRPERPQFDHGRGQTERSQFHHGHGRTERPQFEHGHGRTERQQFHLGDGRVERAQFHHGHGRSERTHNIEGADFTGRKHHGGGCLDHGACQTLFADRMRMEQRAEFRGQIKEIRHEVRHLMGSVENGKLTAEQQTKFDGLVQDIVDLKEEFGIRRGHHANASDVGDRILNRFGVERAAVDCTCDGTVVDSPDPDAAASATETPDMAETAETPASCGDSHAAVETCSVEAECEATGPVVETPAQATGVVDAEAVAITVTVEEADAAATTTEVTSIAATTTTATAEVTSVAGGVSSEEVAKLVDQLASTIIDAEALIEELVKAIG